MGIKHPLHRLVTEKYNHYYHTRRVLKTAATANYTSVLQTGMRVFNLVYSLLAAVPEAQDLGSVVVYKVVSRWRFARGTVILRYSDFRRMHR